MPSHLSKPLIPQEFLERLKSDPVLAVDNTVVTSRQWHELRINSVKRSSSTSPDTILVLSGDRALADSYRPEDGKTWLHYGAETGDVQCALDIIRLGASIDLKDGHGHTPLSRGMMMLSQCSIAFLGGPRGSPAQRAARGLPDLASSRTMVARLRWVCRLLIEQHADVNVVVDDTAPLDYACLAKDWEMIALLLKHRADPRRQSAAGRPVDQLGRKKEDKERFNKLVEETSGLQSRPPRMCPCWSGKALVECHAAGPQPYPSEFTCRCGSGKTYAKCCLKRGIEYRDQWDDVDQWIRCSQTKIINLPMDSDNVRSDDVTGMIESLQRMMAQRDAAEGVDGRYPGKVQEAMHLYAAQVARSVAETMVPSGLADPAFAYAISKADFCPIPRGRSFVSKEEGKELSDVWNGFVDEYIAQGSDERPRVEIERAAKINTHCGALFRVCEGPSCGKLEGRDVERLSLCSKCKIAVYCGRTCQAASWKEHKEQCSSGSRVEQMLPSQAAIQEHVFPALWKDALNLTDHVLWKAPEK